MTKLFLSFYFSNYNGGMNLLIKNNGVELSSFSNMSEGIHNFDCYIELPAVLTFEISGKDYNLDTQVVEQKIINDKFLQLKSMSLGNIPIKEPVLLSLCNYHTDQSDTVRHDLFWGFNGIASININDTNFLK